MPDIEGCKIALPAQGHFEQLVILAPGHLDCAECSEVVRHKLGIEEPIAAGLEPGDQMDKRHLGGIANAVEHALAEECAAKCHSVKSADQLVALIYFQT